MKKLRAYIEYFEGFVGRWWYGPVLFLCAGMDHYVLALPILGMMVSSIFLAPKKWFSITIWSATGSWVGAWILAWISQNLGLSFIQTYFPAMLEAAIWESAQRFFSQLGTWLLFASGLAPVPQQPATIIVALAGTSLMQMAWVMLAAKLLKFGLIGYLASHAPQRLSRFKEVRGELEELHIKPPATLENS